MMYTKGRRQRLDPAIKFFIPHYLLHPPNKVFEYSLVQLMEDIWSYTLVNIDKGKSHPEGFIFSTSNIAPHTLPVHARSFPEGVSCSCFLNNLVSPCLFPWITWFWKI